MYPVAPVQLEQLTPAIITPAPMVRPGGFATGMLTVTFSCVGTPVVAALVVEIALRVAGREQTEASPLVHAGVVAGDSPAGHGGIGKLNAVKVSVTGLYNSPVLSAVWDGFPVGVVVARNELPVEPPMINTWPSSAVPLPSIRVTLGPLRAMVILKPLPLPA